MRKKLSIKRAIEAPMKKQVQNGKSPKKYMNIDANKMMMLRVKNPISYLFILKSILFQAKLMELPQ